MRWMKMAKDERKKISDFFSVENHKINILNTRSLGMGNRKWNRMKIKLVNQWTKRHHRWVFIYVFFFSFHLSISFSCENRNTFHSLAFPLVFFCNFLFLISQIKFSFPFHSNRPLFCASEILNYRFWWRQKRRAKRGNEISIIRIRDTIQIEMTRRR